MLDEFGYLLSDLPEEYVTPEILQIRNKQKTILAQKRYRSTIDNVKLTSLFAAEKGALENTAISIDGKNFDLERSNFAIIKRAADKWV